MGCTSSTENQDGQPKLKPVPLIAASKSNDLSSKDEDVTMFRGVFPNQIILCRDEFESKYTNELMYRWRPAEILKVEGDAQNRVLVHYCGWADTFDHWVDLEQESSKLAPEKLLSKDQCNRGGELTEVQAKITREYFTLGREYAPHEEPATPKAPQEARQVLPNADDAMPKVAEATTHTSRLPMVPTLPVGSSMSPPPVVAKRRTGGASSLRPPGEDTDSISGVSLVPSIASVPPAQNVSTSLPQLQQVQEPQSVQQQTQIEPPRAAPSSTGSKKVLAPVRLAAPIDPTKKSYVLGDQIEVLDIFFKKGATKPSQKWRPAEVVEVIGEYVTIHYDNWDDKYNERLHVVKDAHRLGGPLGSRGPHSRVSHSSSSTTDIRKDRDAARYSSNGSVNSGGSGENGQARHSRSDENMNKNLRIRHEGGGSSTNGQHLPMAVPPSHAPAVTLPPLASLRAPSNQPKPAAQHQDTDRNASAIIKAEQQNEGSELDKGGKTPVSTTASPISSDVRTLAIDNKPPVLSLAINNTDAAGPDAEQLTPEQRNFTRNFFNYKKKKQAELQQATMIAISEDGPVEESKKKDTSESSRGSVRKGLAKMTFGGLFNAAKDGLTSKSGSPRSVGKNDSTDPDNNGVAVAVAVEGEPTEDERNEEEIAARERLFLEKLEAKGLHVFAIEGDGNCLFRAISHQLYLEQDRHDELRARCVEHLIRHRKRFEVFSDGDFDEHLKEMSKLGTWADDLEIRALEEITDRVITIYSSNADTYEPINNNFEEKNLLQGVPPLTLSYHGQSHYNSIYDERYPLPLVERKSRLLLRSRLALTQQDLLPSLNDGAVSTNSRHSPPRISNDQAHYASHQYHTSNGSNSHAHYENYHDYDAYSQSGSSVHSPGPVSLPPAHGYPTNLGDPQVYLHAPHAPPQGYAYPTPVGYHVDAHGQYVETDGAFANAANMDYYYEQQQQQQPYELGYDPAMYEQPYNEEYEQDFDPNDYVHPDQQVAQQNAYMYAANNGYTAQPHHQHLPMYNYGYSHGY